MSLKAWTETIGPEPDPGTTMNLHRDYPIYVNYWYTDDPRVANQLRASFGIPLEEPHE